MKRAWLLAAVLFLLVASLSHAAPSVRAQSADTLAASGETTFYLLPGTIVYSGYPLNVTYQGSVSFSNVSGAQNCEVSVASARVSYGGLKPEITAFCYYWQPTAYVTVVVDLAGTYTGGSVTAPPFSYVTVKLLNGNGTVVATATLYPSQPISVVEDTITQVMVVNISSISYAAVPPNPTVGQEIQFVPAGNVTLGIYFSEPPSYSTLLTLKYKTGSVTFVPNGSAYTTVSAENVPLGQSVPITIYNNGMVIYSGGLSMPGTQNYGGAIVTTGMPILNLIPPSAGVVGQPETQVAGQIYVISLEAGEVTVEMNVNNVSTSATVTTAGPINVTVTLTGQVTDITGYYIITYSNDGQNVSVRVPFSQNYSLTVGDVVEIAFMMIFAFLVVASALMILAGLFLRNFGIVSIGFMTLIGAILLFLIPTLIGDVMYLLNLAGFQDPALVGTTLTLQTLGTAIDRSIAYVHFEATLFGTLMTGVGAAFLAAGTALYGAAAGSTATIFGSPLAEPLGNLANEVLTFGAVASILGLAMSALGELYGVFIAVVIVVMLFVAVVQIVFGAVTGNMAPAFNTIIGMAAVILMVLLAPVLLATLGRVAYQSTIQINLGITQINIPTPATLGIVVFAMVILVIILVVALQRLIATLGGMTGLGAMI